MSAVNVEMKSVSLEVTVANHPGVMSHICGLFSRRAFNLEGILCMPLAGDAVSRIWLKVKDDHQLEQILKQLRKLQDVKSVEQHGTDHEVFVQLEKYFQM